MVGYHNGGRGFGGDGGHAAIVAGTAKGITGAGREIAWVRNAGPLAVRSG